MSTVISSSSLYPLRQIGFNILIVIVFSILFIGFTFSLSVVVVMVVVMGVVVVVVMSRVPGPWWISWTLGRRVVKVHDDCSLVVAMFIALDLL